jgi:hypothetical protein
MKQVRIRRLLKVSENEGYNYENLDRDAYRIIYENTESDGSRTTGRAVVQEVSLRTLTKEGQVAVPLLSTWKLW